MFRLARADWFIAAIDGFIGLVISIGLIYAWRTGKTQRVSIVLFCCIAVASIVGVKSLGMLSLLWSYSLFVAGFFLLNWRWAISLSFCLLAILLMQGTAFPSLLLRVVFGVTAALTCCYAYAFAYQTERQRRLLEKLAAHDPLTGVLNRRSLWPELVRAQQVYERQGVLYGLLVVDIDHFKKINDTWGHDAGDDVLVAIVQFLQASIRKTDYLFRYGGEEFVVLVNAVTAVELENIADTLCRKVAQELSFRGQHITVSIGGALSQQQESTKAWVARADAALYRAKGQGRNRAIIDLEMDKVA